MSICVISLLNMFFSMLFLAVFTHLPMLTAPEALGSPLSGFHQRLALLPSLHFPSAIFMIHHDTSFPLLDTIFSHTCISPNVRRGFFDNFIMPRKSFLCSGTCNEEFDERYKDIKVVLIAPTLQSQLTDNPSIHSV